MIASLAKRFSASDQRLASGEIHLWISTSDARQDSAGFSEAVLSRYWPFRREAPAILRSESGKPTLAGNPLHFSVSHSGGRTACAVTTAGPVGVDLEYRVPDRSVTKLARRFYGPQECEQLLALGSEARNVYFHDLWVLKEAWIKAGGGTLWRDLMSTQFELQQSGILAKIPLPADPEAYCCLLEGVEDFSLALCLHSADVGPPNIQGLEPVGGGGVKSLNLRVKVASVR